MLERALNAFWILLGAGAAWHAWTLGLTGPSGPESGLFPLISALIVMGAGLALFTKAPLDPKLPHGAALRRVAGVIVGLAVMAAVLPYAGFAVTGAITMLVLLRTAGNSGWVESVVLSLASVAAVLWIFGRVLGMVLPRGPWGW
jgi:putative tricarboxylic transport membrane protein